MRGRLGPDPGRVDRVAAARDDELVEGVLDVGSRTGLVPETGRVRLILGEEQLEGSIAVKPVVAELMVRGLDDAGCHLA